METKMFYDAPRPIAIGDIFYVISLYMTKIKII